MDMTIPMLCTRCGKAVSEDHPAHDGKGNLYCHACMQRLAGNGVHPSLAAHACGLCGTAFHRSADAVRAKGNYCDDCLARLRGQRPRRKIAAPLQALSDDRTFDQMLEEVFSGGALAGGLHDQLAIAS